MAPTFAEVHPEFSGANYILLITFTRGNLRGGMQNNVGLGLRVPS